MQDLKNLKQVDELFFTKMRGLSSDENKMERIDKFNELLTLKNKASPLASVNKNSLIAFPLF